jgi:UDP-N-acetylmuramoylalanine--D-glutamate ligase
VLELSSWQLEGLGEAKLSPQYACYLNLYPDHLDRYGSMRAYAEAKEQIFLHQRETDVAVLNSRVSAYSDAYTNQEYGWKFWEARGRKFWFLGIPENKSEYLNPGQHFTDKDGFVGWDEDVLRSAKWNSDSDQQEWIEELICTKADVILPGAHNLENIAAAAALAKAFGIENEHIRSAIRGFTGVEHRLEFVRELDGVRYINDTAATAPEAAIAALRSFERPIVLIAGGADKQLPFDELAREIVLRAKAAVLLQGTATPKLQSAISSQQSAASGTRSTADRRLPAVTGPFHDFEQAIDAARQLAAPGDVVLLSPGCASFGMFRNEFHRGEEFRSIVNRYDL